MEPPGRGQFRQRDKERILRAEFLQHRCLAEQEVSLLRACTGPVPRRTLQRLQPRESRPAERPGGFAHRRPDICHRKSCSNEKVATRPPCTVLKRDRLAGLSLLLLLGGAGPVSA